MRFSTLALLIALPAAAYAAVCPQQFSVEPEYDCAEKGESCYGRTCCGDLQCVWVGWHVGVCPSASALPLHQQEHRLLPDFLLVPSRKAVQVAQVHKSNVGLLFNINFID